jgi:hypothetical protein
LCPGVRFVESILRLVRAMIDDELAPRHFRARRARR